MYWTRVRKVRTSCRAIEKENLERLISGELVPDTRFTMTPNHFDNQEICFGVKRAHFFLRAGMLETLLHLVFRQPGSRRVPRDCLSFTREVKREAFFDPARRSLVTD